MNSHDKAECVAAEVKQVTISGSEARQGKAAKRKIETYHNAVRS